MASTEKEFHDQKCPECGSDIFAYRQFRNWCPTCEWNLGSHEDASAPGRTGKIYDKISAVRGEAAFKSILSQSPENLRPRWTPSNILAHALATLIHLVTLAMAGLAIYAFSFGWSAVLLILIGTALLCLAWTMRPRLGWMPDEYLVREDAPALFALCDRIADKVGSPRASGIQVNGDYNAGFARLGMPRKTLLIIGLPMWLVQTWPERVATLAHEFSHGANGDCTRGLLVGSALDALEHWLDFLQPEYDAGSGAIVGNHLFWILFWPVNMLHLGLSHLVWGQSQLAEFLADYLATTVAGSKAMIDDLRQIANGSHLSVFASKSILGSQQSGREVIGKFVTYYNDLPEGELERLRRLSDRENARLDSTHPPTRQRIEFINAHPVLEPAVIVDEVEQALIEAELERVKDSVGEQMIRDWAPER